MPSVPSAASVDRQRHSVPERSRTPDPHDANGSPTHGSARQPATTPGDEIAALLSPLAEQLAQHERTIERLCIQAIGWDVWEDTVKRLDALEEQLRRVSQKVALPW